MSDEPGFLIGAEVYPIPTTFRLGDPVLVREVTGMDFEDFAEAVSDDLRQTDPVIVAGLIAIAVWQKHPRWRRERVLRFVESLDVGHVKTVDAEHEGEDAGPPAPGAENS